MHGITNTGTEKIANTGLNYNWNGMKFVVSIYRDEDGAYVAECPSVPGCVSQGETEAEAESNIADAIRECLAVRAELGMPLTVTTREVEVPV
jgi:predicted RNase H-like HicB family nuclease